MRLIDRTGNRYGRLVVIGKNPTPAKSGGSLWNCKCDCGNEKIINGSNLKTTHSCGCLAAEWSQQMGSNPAYIARRRDAQRTHGHRIGRQKTVEYNTWLAIKRRCYDPSYKDYPNWGGRGIRVCERWNASFSDFLSDMGYRPNGQYSIDRIDPDGDYEPTNCRWATIQEQGAEHCRNNRVVTHEGVTYPSLAAACRALGISVGRSQMRVNAGLPMDKVLAKHKLSRWDKD